MLDVRVLELQVEPARPKGDDAGDPRCKWDLMAADEILMQSSTLRDVVQ